MNVQRSALVEHSAEDIFDLIEQAEHYPAFLPWCASATILARDDSIVAARIAIAWHGIHFEITTRNPKKRPEWLSVRMETGPFRRFDGEWRIRALAPSASKIEFALRCEFDNALLRGVAGSVLERISATFVDAFVRRADVVYGTRSSPGAPDADAPASITQLAPEVQAKNVASP
jgi:ribosome-associated toxin RatA of RatAB toxin-antitoxin module